jgi:hypothetical protein
MKPVVLLFILCLAAALAPLRSTPAQRGNSSDAFPGWATAPLPTDLTPVASSAREARFAAGFPGQIGVFTDGTRTYVVRWVRTPTRKLHPASDCLRALGYTVKPTPIFASADRSHWGTSSAQHGSEQLRVHERIVDSVGHEWTDVSAWFWSAALGRSAGPWWAVTILEPNQLSELKAAL